MTVTHGYRSDRDSHGPWVSIAAAPPVGHHRTFILHWAANPVSGRSRASNPCGRSSKLHHWPPFLPRAFQLVDCAARVAWMHCIAAVFGLVLGG